jgi:hypothetical protein
MKKTTRSTDVKMASHEGGHFSFHRRLGSETAPYRSNRSDQSSSQRAKVDDSKEKHALGELWEKRRGGRCLFLFAEKSVGGLNVASQLVSKLG